MASTSEPIQAWRLVKSKHADNAFDGEGAFRFGGRWNSRGQRAVYASSTLALALLEVLVHLDPGSDIPELVAFSIQISKASIQTSPFSKIERLSDGFSHPMSESRRMGDQWLKDAPTPALLLPSTIIPVEQNLLLNPEHPEFDQIQISRPEKINLDPRLIDP